MSELICPDCRLPLTAARLGPVPVHACRCCGGAWFPQGQLRSVAAAGDRVVRKLAEHLRAARNAVPPAPAVSPACPECRQPLVSNPSSTVTGVEIRACIPCSGHWATMRSLQVLASQLTPRERRSAAPQAEAAPGSAKRSDYLPSWKVTGPCPRCLGDRQTIECVDVSLEVCSDCGGAWIEAGSHASLLAKSQGARTRLLGEVKRVRSGRHRKPQRELQCPTCLVQMTAASNGTPTCPKCTSSFIDFYALPDCLSLTPPTPPPAMVQSGADTVSPLNP